MNKAKGRILIVEDDVDQSDLVKMILEPEGYETSVAINGREALAKLDSDPHDLVILDVMMPELDGFAVCSRLRESPQHSNIPVILVTAVAKRISDTDYPLDGVLRADADEYFEKPVEPAKLVNTIARLLKRQ